MPTPSRSVRCLVLLGAGLLVLGGVRAAAAHSGRLTVAAAVDSIVVDGDLADWPGHLPRYPITNASYGDPPVDATDLAAWFRVAYDRQANRLYVAVEVTDQSQIMPPGTRDWTQADGCELYLDVTHGLAMPVQLARYGESVTAMGSPSLLGSWQRPDVTFAVVGRPVTGGYVYEWSVDMATVGEGVQLAPGVDIAFDVAVEDRDDDGSFTWISWGPDTGKLEGRNRLGDLIAVGGGQTFGEAIAESGDLLGRSVQRVEEAARRSAGYFAFLAGALLAVALLHFLLFLFQRETRTNLYYALFAAVTIVAIALQYLLPSTGLGDRLTGDIVGLWVVFVLMASLLLLYGQFRGGLTPVGKALLAGLVLAALVGMAHLAGPLASLAPTDLGVPRSVAIPGLLDTVAAASVPLSLAAVTILVLGAVLRRRDGAWSVGVSFLVLSVCAVLAALRLSEGVAPHPGLLAGILLPLGAMSFRLARSVSEAHRDLARRYEEVESLSTRLREQNRELEAANVKIQEQSEQVAEANRLKSDFLARMSHDLRTPLNAIIGFNRILLRRLRGTVGDRQYRNLENIRISADSLLTLINDILDLSRIESGRTEVQAEDVDLVPLATDCAAGVASLVPAGVELVTDLPEALVVRTDADRLRRVLTNLLGNAVKYTDAGSIRLEMHGIAAGAELVVADTGVGIPAADLPYVFDEFRQVDRKDKRREGSGLGLAIARRSIEILGGTVEADSIVGEGATFTVRLPRTPPREAARQAPLEA